MVTSPSCYALVPAAGSGARMAAVQAKQYLSLAGKPVIAHALHTLCELPQIEAVFVVLAAGDEEWPRHDWSALGDKLRPLFCGGATRAESVVNGLRAMERFVRSNDWVLVHDAARPCLTVAHVETLLREVGTDPVGGILALPVADTLKRADERHRISATVARDQLWQAQTPQMFRHAMLLRALTQHPDVTDESGAIEAFGHQPKLVASDASNLKVTWPQDLALAEAILLQRNKERNER